MKTKPLQAHITATYIMLRYGMAALAIALPFLLVIGGFLLAELPWQASMSAYYHAGNGAMRDGFVGILFALGVFLMLYKGLTFFENGALNLAGFLLLIVALVPMTWDCGNACPRFSWHGAAAVVFFLAIAYVCIFRAKDTLPLIDDPATEKRFARAYDILGGCMLASPAIAFVVKWLLPPQQGKGSIVFFIEAAGVIIFGIYWIVKSCEIGKTHAEQEAVEGRLYIDPYRLTDVFRPIKIERVREQDREDPLRSKKSSHGS